MDKPLTIIEGEWGGVVPTDSFRNRNYRYLVRMAVLPGTDLQKAFDKVDSVLKDRCRKREANIEKSTKVPIKDQIKHRKVYNNGENEIAMYDKEME